jgi:catechol 2,3-dioxygenase-like lactoylglutathione lyase family enzyme
MIQSLDHIIVAVSNLDEAEQNYSKLFGKGPVWRGEHKEYGTSNCLFNFENTYFELLAASGDGLGAALVNYYLEQDGEGLIGLVLGCNNINEIKKSIKDKGFIIADETSGEGINFKDQKVRKWKNLFLPPELTRGLFSFIIEHTFGSLPIHKDIKDSAPHKLDHLVINTNDAEGFIRVYRDVFNIRLALDKVVKEWKSRMLFFRTNKTTIEVIEKKDDREPQDKLWGLAWEVNSIKDTHSRLIKDGVEVSSIKKGIKENTLVATIKSHTHNVPTLLIEHI